MTGDSKYETVGRVNVMASDQPIGSRRQPTIREVAAAAGVSISTVSRVAGGSARVAGETRAKVLAAMASVGYQPNAAARAMRTNKTKTIGFLMPDIANPVFSKVALGAESVLGPAGYTLFALSSNRSPDREVEYLQAVRQRQMDGLIVTLADETAATTIEELRRMRVPVVLLDRDVDVGADVVFSDHMLAMETVIGHLIALGHRRIGLVTASEKIRPGRERVRGFRRALGEAGIPVDEWLIRARTQSAEYGASETHDLLTGADPPTAIVAAGSDIFYGAFKAVRLLRREVPRDLSFVGADDLLLSEVVGPPVTIIDRDMVEVGREAGRLLLDRLNGIVFPPRRVLLPSTVVLRNSIAAPRHH
jgi:LacI family transcriptional regulator, galactose operon repressor